MNDVAVNSDLTPEDSIRDISTAAAKAKSDTQGQPYKLQHAGTCRKLKLRLCALLCHAKQSDKSPSNSCEVGCEKTFLSSRELRSPHSSTTALSDKLQSSDADIAGDTIHIPIVAAIHTDLVNEVNHAANSPTDKIEHSNDVLEHVTIERRITLSDKMSAASHSASHSIVNGEVGHEQNIKGNPDSAAIKESDTNNASNGLPVINLSQTSVDESDITSKVADISETTVTAAGELTGQEPRRVSLTPNMIGPLQLSPGAVLDNDGFTYRLTFPGATSQSVTQQSASPGLTQPVLLVLPDSSHTEEIADNFTTDVTLRETSAKLHHSLSTRRDTLLELPLNYVKSPDGRYIKLDEEVGRGSFKTVYKGLDCETGVNVAWCELMDAGRKTRANRLKFKEEVEMLKGLRHHNILRFYDSWECNKKIVLVTELMTSGTLKLYIKRFRKISTKLIANWCRQILKGLVFLHTRTPPVIHRDLKCDNFFINGQSGRVKIGDLGLAILKPQSFARTVIGTPEFMAPEMYEEHYDERVDVYAFGMCMLEMATSEYPYKECTNPGQIYKRVTKGVRPDSYHRVENQEHKHIIDRCIQYKPDDRMSAGELLQLDFFNEWSVHLDCSWTSQRDVLQFRIRDDVIRTKNHQKEGEAIQFDFNLNDDEPNKMAAELVNNGYLDEGNTKVAVKLMKEKIAFFDTQKRTRLQSMSQDVPKQPRRSSSDESKPLDGEGAGDTSRSRTDSTSSQAAADHHSADGKRRRNSTTKTPTKELEAQKQRKRKALQILIEDISKEDNSTSVTCRLQASKATVTFTFNSDVDTPEDISENLVAYVDHPQQLSVAKEQIQFIFDLVKKHKDQPELAKKICEQKHHIPASNHHTSSSSTGGGDSNRPTPVHSRSSSKDLVSFVDQPVFSDYKQPLVRSNSHDDRPTPSTETAKPGLDSAKLPVSPAKDPAVADFAMPRDRSGTWHTSQLPNRSLSVNEEKLRRESMPGRSEKPFASRPSQLSVIPSGMSAPNTPLTLKKPLGDATGEANPDHKKASDIAELSKSIERIMYSDKSANPITTQSSHTTPTHPTSYVSRSLTSSPRLRKKFVTRLLSTASRTDGGDLISPNDSLGTNSTTLSNYNSLTCDSGFCAILPKTVRTNSICEPLAETTKKVGRFKIGIVKEQVSPARSPSPDAFILPAITASPVTVPVSIASDTSLDEVTSVLARISERNQQTSPHTVSCPQCVLDSELDDDASLQLIKARQAAERRELEDRQQTEIEVYKTGKKALQTYSENCEKCAQQQVRLGNSKVLCEVHSIAKLLQELAMSGSNSGNRLLTDSRSVSKQKTMINKMSSDDEMDGGISLENDSQLGLVSSYLRSGKHFDKEVSKVRRLRHNSVEMVLQRMWSSDAESPPYNDSSSDVTRSAIAEESDDVITDMNNGSALCEFQYPQIDLSRVLERESSSDRIRLIQDEVSQSHRAVIAGLQHQCELNNEALSGASRLAKADHAHSRQQMVKQALQESQAQLLKSLQNALHS